VAARRAAVPQAVPRGDDPPWSQAELVDISPPRRLRRMTLLFRSAAVQAFWRELATN
jgi:hypothetical protein